MGEVLHTFAPTAQFKCCCDSCGNDTKSWLRKQELSGNIRVTNAWSAFKEMHANMGQPGKRNRHTSFRFQLSARYHYFVVYANMQTDEMKTHDRVITCITPHGTKGGKDIVGIRGMYQLRAIESDAATRMIFFRKIACHCKYCVISNYVNCLIKSEWKKWKSLDLFKAISTKPKQIRHCKACGASDHNKRNSKCQKYAETAAARILQQSTKS
jgi:hypothetical protein